MYGGVSGVMVGILDGRIVASLLVEVTEGKRHIDESYYGLAGVLAQ